MIKCLLCNKDFGAITDSHLKFKHYICTDEYKKIFPGVLIRDVRGENNPMYGVYRYGKDNPYYGIHRYGKNAPAYGHHLNLESIEKMSKATLGKKHIKSKSRTEKILNGTYNPQNNAFKGQGYRNDIKQFFRSRWEANEARVFNYSGVKWEYESKNCRFDLKELGVVIVDFYLPELDLYIEIKGFWRDGNKEKFRRLVKDYPLINLKILDRESYRYFENKYHLVVPNWERSLCK